MAAVLYRLGKYREALKTYKEVFDVQKAVLGSDHPHTLLTESNMAIVLQKQESECLIQSNQKQQKAYFHLSQFVSNNFHNASIESAKQGLYLPSFEARNIKVNGKCTAITRGLSQALFLHGDKSFLSNLEISAEIYERIAQDKQISEKEKKKVFALTKLLDNFEQQQDSVTNSLPSSLIHTQSYKTFGDLSHYIAGIKGDFAIHLVTSNHVVAIYRIDNNYAYFDSNVAFVSGLESVNQLMEVLNKAMKLAGYKVKEEGFLVEHFNVDKANNSLSDENKQILTKEAETECQLTASNNNQRKSRLPETTDEANDKPESYLSGVTVNNQLQRSL